MCVFKSDKIVVFYILESRRHISETIETCNKKVASHSSINLWKLQWRNVCSSKFSWQYASFKSNFLQSAVVKFAVAFGACSSSLMQYLFSVKVSVNLSMMVIEYFISLNETI